MADFDMHRRLFERTGENAEVLTPHHLATYFGEPFQASVAIQIGIQS